MTPYTINVDAASLILERITGLVSLAETHLNTLIDLDSMESIPLNATIYCINSHIAELNSLLSSGLDPKRAATLSQSDLESALSFETNRAVKGSIEDCSHE